MSCANDQVVFESGFKWQHNSPCNYFTRKKLLSWGQSHNPELHNVHFPLCFSTTRRQAAMFQWCDCTLHMDCDSFCWFFVGGTRCHSKGSLASHPGGQPSCPLYSLICPTGTESSWLDLVVHISMKRGKLFLRVLIFFWPSIEWMPACASLVWKWRCTFRNTCSWKSTSNFSKVVPAYSTQSFGTLLKMRIWSDGYVS